MSIEQQLANDIRSNNLVGYQKHRYPSISDGEPLVFTDEDFTDVDFGQFVVGFFEFHNCTLDRARHLYGQPITFVGCSCKGLDMRWVSAVIEAKDSDFTGLLYDRETVLGSHEEGAVSSVFEDCQLDEPAKAYFMAQGVIFR
jgi:hypothetical protein